MCHVARLEGIEGLDPEPKLTSVSNMFTQTSHCVPRSSSFAGMVFVFSDLDYALGQREKRCGRIATPESFTFVSHKVKSYLDK